MVCDFVLISLFIGSSLAIVLVIVHKTVVSFQEKLFVI